MTIATHPAKSLNNVKRVKSVRKRSRMVMRSKIRISDQDEVRNTSMFSLINFDATIFQRNHLDLKSIIVIRIIVRS